MMYLNLLISMYFQNLMNNINYQLYFRKLFDIDLKKNLKQMKNCLYNY